MSGLKCFYFGEEAVPPVRHDKMKKKKEFARVPREKYDRLTQEVTFKKPHVSCGFSPVYYIHRGAEYIDTRAKRKKTKGGKGRREEGGELFHNDDSRLSLLVHVVRLKKAALTGTQHCSFYFVPAGMCRRARARACMYVCGYSRWIAFFETFRRLRSFEEDVIRYRNNKG